MTQRTFDNTEIPVESTIYKSFVKYERLRGLVYSTFANTSLSAVTNLNIYIDLYSVLKPLFSEHYRTKITEETMVTSEIINMCGHYRRFFRTLGVDTNIYLVFSYNICDINRQFVGGYNETFYNKSNIKLFRNMVDHNIELLEILVPYLPNIYFIKSIRNYESTIIIQDLILNHNENNYPGMIISNDLYPIQLTSMNNICQLIPIKHGEDESIMIPVKENTRYRDAFWNFIGYRRNIDVSSIVDLSPINFALFSAMTRFPERNIGSLGKKTSTIGTIIRKIVGNSDTVVNMDLLEEELDKNSIARNIVETRFKVLSSDYIYNYYINDPESKSYNLNNLSDPATINTINARFFQNNPIDVFKL